MIEKSLFAITGVHYIEVLFIHFTITGAEKIVCYTEDFVIKTSDFFKRLRNSLGIFGNDRVVFKNPSTPRIKISRLYLRKSWQVYKS